MSVVHSPNPDATPSGIHNFAAENAAPDGRTAPVPRLLVELPARPRVFLTNLRDLFFPRRLPALELRSAPAAFWHDVFVSRPLPWSAFFQSGLCHALAFMVLIGFSRILALQPRVAAQPAFEHSQVVYYSASEYLPPLDTRQPDPPPAQTTAKADPEFAPQPIISVPPEADNHKQTIVTPPSVRLNRDLALPNVVAWSGKIQQPQLAIPAVPLIPAAQITRIQPQLDSVVAPPPDTSQLTNRSNRSQLQAEVVAPPPDLHTARDVSGFHAPQPSVVAPPPAVDIASNRPLGQIDISRAEVIAPAPALPVAEQRVAFSGRLSASHPSATAQVVPPPPAAAGSFGSSGRGSSGQMIALSLHPAVGAPPDPPVGNRRGSFAATPEGHVGASGATGSSSAGSGTKANSGSNENGSGSGRKASAGPSAGLPDGLYVGHAPASTGTAPVAGDPVRPAANAVRPNLVSPSLLAGARAFRPATPSSPQSGAVPITEAERVVFAGRKFYSATITSPNLNSARGSWVVRFAEKNAGNANASGTDLTQPYPTREVDPAYPLELMRENVHGTVILYAVIHGDGSVADIRVLSSADPRLDRFAAEALAQWRFHPATKNGVPVDVDATFQIPFRPAFPGNNF